MSARTAGSFLVVFLGGQAAVEAFPSASLLAPQSPLLPGRALPGPIGEGNHRTEPADVDGDGRTDLVIWRFGGSLVRVAYAEPDGSLGLPVKVLETGDRIFGLALGELNGDDILDIVTVTTPAFEHVTPYLSSQGSWQAGPGSSWPFDSIGIGREFRLADVDSDGELDLFARGNVATSQRPEVARGLGGGQFEPALPAVGGFWWGSAYEFVDLNGDGDLDLVAAGFQTPTGVYPAAVIYGSGSLPLNPQQTVLVGASEPSSRARDLAIFDAEGDGDLDLFVLMGLVGPSGASSGREVLVASQASGPSFGPMTVAATTASFPDRILGADAEGDGDMDLILMSPYGGGPFSPPFWFALRGPQAYGPLVAATAPLISRAYFASVADFDGDGLMEVASSATLANDPATPLDESAPAILHHEFNVSGTFVELPHSPINEESVLLPLAAPFREGELPVLFVTESSSQRWYYKPNQGEGRFGRRVEISFLRGRAKGGITLGDLNADGNNDIVFSEYNGVFFDYMLAFGDGAGGFTSPMVAVATTDAFGSPAELIDIDRDGDLDLSFINAGFLLQEHHAAFNDGMGVFSPSAPLFPGFFAQALGEFADVNGDGLLDIVIPVQGGLQLALGLGGTDFATPVPLLLNGPMGTLRAIADFTGDGVQDLILMEINAVSPASTLLLARGLGNGMFAPNVPLATLPPQSYFLRAIDLDLDDVMDLVYSMQDPEGIVFLKGLGQGSLGAPVMTPTEGLLAGSVGSTPFVDLDLDGDLDFPWTSREGIYNQEYQFHIVENGLIGDMGTVYCGGDVPNSSGAASSIRAIGRSTVAANLLRLDARDLPRFSFTFFLTSRTQGFVPNVIASEGTLCLGGRIGRYTGPGQIQNSGSGGTVSLDLDLSAMPDPLLGLIQAQAGETWSFQAWHRDFVPGIGITSNFSSAVEVLLR
ncbi:FG-GAP repeat domain-containing protein [Saltatorellus ferox]|uniref:FG-GAP repeat domain-containing protein n=1 Tax=Saltatorellus ferox TaxID=2528018 RepID=UPI003AF34FF6